MAVNDELGKRMKIFYEQIPKTKLMRRTPVAIRIDGKAFHSFTRGFKRPFDEVLIQSMQDTMQYLCENIQGVILGYHQSDEITLILQDYKRFNTSAWFDYEVQKICSISASMATMSFNRFFAENIRGYEIDMESKNTPDDMYKQYLIYKKAIDKGAMFDSRCFNIPKEEVTNLIYWRQLDATRNSIQMVGQANFSQKELQNKSCNEIQDMLMTQKGINWNNLPAYQKRGSCCIKETYTNIETTYKDLMYTEFATTTRTRWIIDLNIPIFVNEGRDYIEKLLIFEE